MRIRQLFGVLLVVLAVPAAGDTIAIIGTGDVGGAIGAEFASQGHTIVYGSRSPMGLKALDLANATHDTAYTDTPKNAAQAADIVVLAVPGMVAVEVASDLGNLSGKLVIDVTNPLVMDEAMHFTHGVDTSNGERVQAALPGAHVVKALNTVAWQMMLAADEVKQPPSVPLSGNNDNAKQKVAALVSAMGLPTIDIGGIETARWTELTAVILLNNRFSERQNFDVILRHVD
ncbi:MAG: NAD(P)-binding domain-containing protein [Pseudomonadota bacterium]